MRLHASLPASVNPGWHQYLPALDGNVPVPNNPCMRLATLWSYREWVHTCLEHQCTHLIQASCAVVNEAPRRRRHSALLRAKTGNPFVEPEEGTDAKPEDGSPLLLSATNSSALEDGLAG